MIMARPNFRNIDMKRRYDYRITRQPRTAFWFTHDGVRLDCEDHELGVRDYVKSNFLEWDLINWMQSTGHDYKDFRSFAVFSKNWIRVSTTDDVYGITVGDNIALAAYNAVNKDILDHGAKFVFVDSVFEDNRPETSKRYSVDDKSLQQLLVSLIK